MLRWWSTRSNAARFDLFTRATCYLFYLAIPGLLITSTAADLSALAAAPVIILIVAHAVLCGWLTHLGIEHYLGRIPFPRRALALSLVATCALVIGGMIAFPEDTPGKQDGTGDGIKLFVLALFFTALASTVRPRTTALALIPATAFIMATSPPAAALSALLLLATFALIFRISVWMLGVMWELDRARHIQSSLAVAEERLRFARDLHDVVGRNLSVVALKAELAAQLARRDRPEAVSEMLEVRQIAQDSLSELRAVVSGYRTADLATELAGARSLLASAGIDCRVIGTPDVADDVAGALGWAVREGVTNVLRHSQATSCTITLRGKTLTMTNDGASSDPIRYGSGLTGLHERVSALGGTLNTTLTPPNRFVLTVELP